MTLTANQKRALRRMWPGDLTTEEIGDELGLTELELQAAVALLGLGERPAVSAYMPTEAEIRAACAAIRFKWTPAEREARLGRLR